jgi:4,5-DOPA dioxygenase extradiol
MNRRRFIRNFGLSALAMSSATQIIRDLHQMKEQYDRLPAFFIGHGSPMNAIENNEFSQGWRDAGKKLPKPKAILCVSAHWETSGTKVCAVARPKTIHDFMGFPKALFDMQYPAPGSPEFARLTADQIKKTHVELDHEWGLDHGSWSVLCRMFPLADVPVFQLSLDQTKPPQWHYDLAKELKGLRKKGVLIVGSGNLVHNLRLMRINNPAFEWAQAFDEKISGFIADHNHDPVINYRKLGTMADLSVPTNEHYLPLLYTLGVQDQGETVSFFNNKTVMGSVSMRSLKIG